MWCGLAADTSEYRPCSRASLVDSFATCTAQIRRGINLPEWLHVERAEIFALPGRSAGNAFWTLAPSASPSNDPLNDFLLRGPCENIGADSGFSFFRFAKPGQAFHTALFCYFDIPSLEQE